MSVVGTARKPPLHTLESKSPPSLEEDLSSEGWIPSKGTMIDPSHDRKSSSLNSKTVLKSDY